MIPARLDLSPACSSVNNKRLAGTRKRTLKARL